MSKPIVAIVGRPNVGKSTLFNRLVGGRLAIVEDIPGVTRDRIYGDATWLEHSFTVIDTGGIEFAEIDNEISNQMRQQAQLAMEEADVILFVVDGRDGLTHSDEEVANLLRRSSKPVLLVVNKVDNFDRTEQYLEFFALGLGEPILISSAHGYNIGDLLDEVVKHFPITAPVEDEDDAIKIAVIGRPNVGKSSLVNALLGEERVIVSDVPGTTRDAIDTALERDGQKYIIIDTAGMRRKGRIADLVERYSVIRSLRAVDRSDIVLMVIDAVAGLTEQDKKIAGYAHDNGKGCILVVNKWDLVEKDEKTALRFTETLREGLGFMQYAPVIYVSAKTRKRVAKILELVKFVADQQSMRIATSVLNNLIREAIYFNPPPSDRGRRLKILYATQVAVKPPTFVLFVNDTELLHFSYQRYIENQLRQTFGFEGTPIRIIPRNRQEEKE